MPYEKWFDFWWPHVSEGGKKEDYSETLKTGCIGVGATFSGFANIEEFKKELTQCYKSLPKAEAAAKKKVCKGKNYYGKDCGAMVAALQFSSRVVSNGRGGNVARSWKAIAEPIDLAAKWYIVDTAYDDRGQLKTGFFDFQIYVPGQKCWIGANHGVAREHPSMKVRAWPERDLRTHLKEGEKLGYDLKAYCVFCQKKW